VKVLHVYKDFDRPVRGGIEGYMALLCRYQRQWGTVEALTCSRRLSTRIVDRDGTRVTEVGEWGRFQRAPLAPLFAWYLRRIRADVYVVHVPNPTAEMAWLMSRPQGRLVVRYHSDVVRQASAMRYYKPWLMKFLRQADIILPTSEQYVATSPVLQDVRDRCHVVPLGIESAAFQQPNLRRVAELQAQYGGPYVLFSGVHRYYKGLKYLIQAASSIQAPVVLAGTGPEWAANKSLADSLGMEVHFPGALTHEELVAHLHGCAVFVMPSVARSEAFGISIMEAHACAKPVVATRLGTGVEFANLDGQTGINVPPENADALAAAVNELLNDPARATRLGQAGRARVEGELDGGRVARAEWDIYQDVMDRPSRRR